MYFHLVTFFLAGDPPGDSTAPSAQQQVLTQASACDVGRFNHRDVLSSGEEVEVVGVVDECLQQLSDLQLDRVPTFISLIGLISLKLCVRCCFFNVISC